MKQPATSSFIVIAALLLLAAAITEAKRNKLNKPDPYRDFAGDKDLTIAEEPDDKPPSNFAGNVQQAKITQAETRQYGGGKFKNTFETQNGISVSQVGKLRDDKTFVVMGSYSYTGADGRRYRVKYTADEFGYHPITELDLDIPELELEKAKGAGGAGASAVKRQSPSQQLKGPLKTPAGQTTQVQRGSGSRVGPGRDDRFTYGRATPPPTLSAGGANTYLPPDNTYLPPGSTYLPPKPTRATKH